MAVHRTARRLAPLAAVVALGAVGLATPALAGTAPVKTALFSIYGNLTVPAPKLGVNDHLTAHLIGNVSLVGKTLTFTTVASPGTPATFLCTATTDENGIGACDALVGVDPAAITGAGLAQIAAKGAFTVAYAGDASYLAATGKGAATFYNTPGLPGTSAR